MLSVSRASYVLLLIFLAVNELIFVLVTGLVSKKISLGVGGDLSIHPY
jgi:hypothetical protein